MNQLELRTYTRAEIAEALSVNLNDSKHFKRNVENKLSKWGYRYEYTTPAVTITCKPETPKERLAEIVYRCFGMDIQVDTLQFGCFISAFTDIEGFASMPWEERAKAYYKRYGECVDARTLSNWCRHLIEKGIIAVSGDESVAWKTIIIDHKKIRYPLSASEPNEMYDYFQQRSEIFSEEYQLALDSMKYSGFTKAQAKAEAWKETYKRLWADYQCCYYYCKCFTFGAFGDSIDHPELFEVYELAQELAFGASAEYEAKQKAEEEARSHQFIF